jgi:hypothetical protein
MRKLAEVQEAKELMNEAVDWSGFTWMFEKPRVRKNGRSSERRTGPTGANCQSALER